MPTRPSPATSATLTGRDLTLFRGAAPVLVDVSMVVGPRDRIGVVGPNGVGKSTLLRVLAGQVRPDAGSLSAMPPTATIGYLAQELDPRPGEHLAELLGRRSGVAGTEQELAAAAADLASDRPEASERYTNALERYLSLGVADFDARQGRVLAEVGLDPRLLDVPMAGLSGGQRARASLAALLLSRFDVLLLDEPTNDLDFDGLERLERFLGGRVGGLVVVSHDRAFLEGVVSSVVEIDESSHRAAAFAGGFDAYRSARATARRHEEEAHADYVRERDRLRTREREQRQWATRGTAREKGQARDNDKAQRGFRVDRTEKQASKVRITERALERLEVVDKPFEGWQLTVDLEPAARSGDVVARLEGAVVRRGSWQLGPVDLMLSWAERVAVLGRNGAGKSTLLAVILGTVTPTSGVRTLGPSVAVGRLGQERDRFSFSNDGGGTGTGGRDRSLQAAFLSATGLTVSEGRSLLAKFGLAAGHVEREAATLSPGERTRAELALLMATGTNLLVLDEPTNHLDLEAIEQLEVALGAWPGTLLLVSHDRRFLRDVTLTRQLTLEGGRLVGDEAT